ncbi:hypothetical protein, partial [Rhodopseudomonas sp. B29]|uniref:hypothetical protein n=1 Tax=Rhodopseudomonas sp. B29 TaxID=95607 RepID=UPI001AEBF63C
HQAVLNCDARHRNHQPVGRSLPSLGGGRAINELTIRLERELGRGWLVDRAALLSVPRPRRKNYRVVDLSQIHGNNSLHEFC